LALLDTDILSESLKGFNSTVVQRAGAYMARYGIGPFFGDATAIETGRVLVTGNTPHFSWISGLRIEDWRQP